MLKSLFRKKKKQNTKNGELLLIRERIQKELLSVVPLPVLTTPDEFGEEMKQLSLQFDNYPPYFDCLMFDCRYMRPFVRKSADFIIENIIDRDAHILDICGGPGNQGLALATEGFHHYTVADIDENRMAWGELLWRKASKTLRWQREDASKMTFGNETFDVVTLLGWEVPSLPYTYTFRECLRVLKPGGYFIFTYHEADEIVEGNWDFDPSRSYSFLPYSISRKALYTLCERLNLEVIREDESGYPPSHEAFFPDDKARLFPQYIVYTKKKPTP